ncbi:MAG: hypothetical protein AMXMBFR75_11940 [Candidatus Hinthialibacteria bacterium]
MNSRERVLAILDRQPVDRIPVDIWCTGEVHESLCEYAGVQDELELYRILGIDKILWFSARYAGPIRQPQSENESTNFWGMRMQRIQAGLAAYDEFLDFPLAQYDTPKSLDDYPWWPNVDLFDYEAMAAEAGRGGKEFVTLGPWVSIFEIYCWMRGLENAMMDLVMNPEFVHAALDRIESVQTELLKRFFAVAPDKADLVFISDDMGNQNGLMLSLKTWKEFFAPRLKRWCELIHSHGKRVFYHTDGSVDQLIPHLIEAGIDILNPIQHACPGMEMPELKQKYGDQIIFHGGVDNQAVLPFGTPQQVSEETLDCLQTLGKGGGYICCSCHNIQAGTPVENILTMIETVHRDG